MKKLSWFNKTIYAVNVVVALLTIIAYAFPFLAPKLFPGLSVLTLILPLFLIVNVLFFAYWAVQLKRQVLLSAIVLLFGITFINKFYRFSSAELPPHEQDFTVMSYNVRLFNLFEWIPGRVPDTIRSFINELNPDIVCLQEYSKNGNVELKAYRYRHIALEGRKIQSGHGIFSKYPIIDQGSITFPNSSNSAAFADIKRGLDTVRVYSIHLQSVKITPDVDTLNQDGGKIDQRRSEMIFRRITKAFREQQHQAEMVREHSNSSPYPVIICGDMNNSAFSYVYRRIKGNLDDAFEEGGNGFGQTYNFKYYPARIDYIFIDKSIRVKSFRNYPNFKNSDHYPIMARLQFR